MKGIEGVLTGIPLVRVCIDNMSEIVSTPAQIHDSPMNTSSAKHLYSFARGERFPKIAGNM